MARILVIDDDAIMRRMIRQMLERVGYQVDEAESGQAGLLLFRTQPADLVVTDILMPDQDGISTIFELRKEFPDVKIIAVSGGRRATTMHVQALAERAGARHTFAKPIDRHSFLQAVAACLSPA